MTEIICEVASNHGGDPGWQERLIEMVAGAGADTVKFQSYQTRHLSPTDPQYAWLKQAELSDDDHVRLLRVCKQHGVSFLTTVFHADRVAFLAGLGLPAIKVGSGEAGNVALLRAVAEHPWRVYLSTGLMTRAELERANALLGHRPVTLMHTVSVYPTPMDKVNLGRMHWLEQHANRPAGYSDHTEGAAAAMAAMAMGAESVEVHVSAKTAPRCQAWDKTAAEVAYLVNFRDAVDRMKRPGRMLWDVTEPRPYVGRWQRGS